MSADEPRVNPLSIFTAIVSSLCLALLGWLVAKEVRKAPATPQHHSNLPVAPDFENLTIEELAMRFRHPGHYYKKDALPPREQAFGEMFRRKALHKGMKKEDGEFLLGEPYNRNPETGEVRDGVWRYGFASGSLDIEFGPSGLERMAQSHDGPPDVARSEILIK